MQDKLFVSFSGGKTSAYMSYILKRDYSDRYKMVFVFANTGQEHEETLKFVAKCDAEFGLNTVWLEAVTSPTKGIGTGCKVVNYETASRNGEPFESFIRKEGIPNKARPRCSDRLKARAIEEYKYKLGWSGCLHAIGIREDETFRVNAKNKAKFNLCYPLIDWFPTDKTDVNIFWESAPFSLNLEEHEGNCMTCWKKSNKKLWLLALEHPDRFDFMARMEKEYQDVLPRPDGKPRHFFRSDRSTMNIIEEAQNYSVRDLRKMLGADPDVYGNCSESCEAY